MAKPSRNEISQCKLDLNKVEIKVCAICFKENDSKTSDTVEWIECRKCRMWVHLFCLDKQNNSDISTTDDYICQQCHLDIETSSFIYNDLNLQGM